MSVAPKVAFADTSCTFWDIVQQFHKFWRLFGFANFSVDGKVEKGSIKLKFFDIFMAVVINVLIFYVIYLNSVHDLTLIFTKSRVINMASRVVLVFGIANVLLSSAMMMLRRKDVWGIFSRCHKLDEELKTIGMRLNHKRLGRNVLIVISVTSVLFFGMCAATVYFVMNLVEQERASYLITSNMMINMSMTMSLMTASFVLFSIFVRFRLINDSIKAYFVTEEEDEINIKNSPEVLCKIVAKLADLHDSLVDIVNSFNSCFAVMLMNLVAAMFLTDIFSIFAIYRVFVRYDYSQWELAVIQFIWNLYFMIYGFVVVMLGSLVTRTGKYTAVLVHKAVNYIVDDDDPVIDVLKMFSQQMQHRAPVVSCGLFTFDFTLIFTIIGATATYIVILIQFDTDVPVPNKNSTGILTNISFTSTEFSTV